MSMTFQKATKKSARLRMALIGVAGAGKTYTALSIAQNLGQKVAVVDTERGSASKYSDLFEFDVMEMESYGPKMYVDAIKAAEEAGYDVLIIDSLSHAWAGKDGALEMVDRAAKRSQAGNTFGAWRDVSPLHNQMVDAIVSSRIHIIATMRAKTEYVQEKDPKSGRTTVRKIGLAPVQRDGLEYEFDVVATLDSDNNLIVGKTRCPAIAGAVVNKAGREIARSLKNWLTDGAPPDEERITKAKVAPQPQPREPEVEAEMTRSRKRVPASVDIVVEESSDEDAVHCDCGLPARYVAGRSGAGWVCANKGTDEPSCKFRLKDENYVAEPDPFEDEEAEASAEAGAVQDLG